MWLCGTCQPLPQLSAQPQALSASPGPLLWGQQAPCPVVPPTPFPEGQVLGSYLFFIKSLLFLNTLSSVHPRVCEEEDTGPAP